ncbi:LAG1 longevity assurance homolog 2-like [Ipomoea triloba]|uniref:LAG1 longevity assurance homolog 2-like n=1 Tax=Ipomoea triloba TaxID=35885 RepID=UPI00125D8B02|nr:LAG1 longevity assurance homolog 2-like [Ipomoea triloba]
MDSFWSENAVPSASHFAVAVYFAARILLDRFAFRRLAIWLLGYGATHNMNEAKKGKIGKFTESMWKLAYYATVEYCALKVTYHQPWFYDTKQYFRGWPNQELQPFII